MATKKPFHLILAMAKNYGIGFQGLLIFKFQFNINFIFFLFKIFILKIIDFAIGKLPWPMIKKDMLHFKNITTNTNLFNINGINNIKNNKKNAVIMGRKTFESF